MTMNDDRRRQVETTRARHGDDFYKRIAKKGKTWNSDTARLAILKRWHPDWFDENGKLKKEYEK